MSQEQDGFVALSPWPESLPPVMLHESLAGGWVSQTHRGSLADGREVVVKRSPHAADAEVDGLTALAAAGVPAPHVLGHAGGTLVLPYLAGRPDWPALGRAVARMHRTTGPAFGWHRDNHAGRFLQRNAWMAHWPSFYAEHRVRTHLADPAVPRDLAARLRRACDGPLLELLPAAPPAVLTHGDLHAGNTVAGRWLVDPEVSYADRELDLAYMHAGGTLPPPFWRAYERELPYEPGYSRRRPALQLHHLMLQIRHFGAARFRPAVEAVLDTYGW